MTDDGITLSNAPDRERYEIHVDSELAGYLEYRGRGETRALVHTEVFEGNEGRGLGGRLVRHTLEDARAQGFKIVPICPFVHRYLAEHEEYLDLMEPYIRKAFHL